MSLPSWLNGTYYVGVVADPWGYISETNKGNNALAAYNTTTISAPVQIDLAPYFVNAPTSATPGSTTSVSIGISNYGNTASGSFYVGLYATLQPVHHHVRHFAQDGFAAEYQRQLVAIVVESVVLPSWLNGTYYIGVIAPPVGLHQRNEQRQQRPGCRQCHHNFCAGSDRLGSLLRERPRQRRARQHHFCVHWNQQLWKHRKRRVLRRHLRQ